MDPTSLTIAEVEERVRQLTSHIANLDEKRKELNRELNTQKVLLDKLRPKINPFEVFPHLVWENVSHKVEDTQDWLNLYSSSSKMMELLETDKLERVFPEIFSHVRKYLTRKDVINLCGADRKFASAILSWVEMRCFSTRWASAGWRGIYSDVYSKGTPVYYVESQEKIQVITNELSKGDSDFWIPFGLIFQDKDRGGMEYWKRVKIFLQLFGRRIWLCKLMFSTQEYYPGPRRFPDVIVTIANSF